MRKLFVLCIMLVLTISLTSACPIQDAKNAAAKLAAEEAAKENLIPPDTPATISGCTDGVCTESECPAGNCTAEIPVDNGTVIPECSCKCICENNGICTCSCCSGSAICDIVTPIVDPAVNPCTSPIDCSTPTGEEVTPVEDGTGCITCGGND